MVDETLTDKVAEPLKLGVQRRLEFIDFRLLWNGRFNRKDLSDVFQISPQQASADIAAYERRAPQNLRYDNALKAYVRAGTFDPIFMGDLSDRYLLQLVGIRSGWIRQEDTWFETLPPSEVVALKKRRTDSRHLQQVLDAIREKLELEVEYRSINSAGSASRWIAPHALAYSAGRWHIRAWARDRNDFRDFNLNRISGVTGSRSVKVDTNLDYEWNNYIDLILVPNPELDAETQSAVAAEYDMKDGHIVESTRLSLVFYLINELNLDVEPKILNPHKQQLVLQNRPEVETARGVARKMSAEALKRAPTE
jgi:hypothetical protein